MEMELIPGPGREEGGAGPSASPAGALTEAQAALRVLTLASVPAENTRRAYGKAIDELFGFARGRPLTRALLLEFRGFMSALAAPTANLRLSAVRKMVAEAARNGWLPVEEAARLTDVPNLPERGIRLGNWLTKEQARELLRVPDRETLIGKRDYIILGFLVACGLRRAELAALDAEALQMREGRWVLPDLLGKGGRVRTVAVPLWLREAVVAWQTAAGVRDGKLIRRMGKGGRVLAAGLSVDSIRLVVLKAAMEIDVAGLAPHDLRRTCAKLCRKAGGDLEQIKFLLGHSSIQTTERYLGSEQEIAVAVNDSIGL